MNNQFIGSSFDDFLEEKRLGQKWKPEQLKRSLRTQLRETLEKEHLTKTELAQRLATSRAAVDRLLDPGNESVTLLTLQKAASVLGKN
ncbi:MAG: helix-turn-helix domain-containing protein [Treponema sp.]|jgi:DNA-binding Xre family transcriptional regulator|nr:helix-turn-helix domain-containing protein [Treponema sp.]